MCKHLQLFLGRFFTRVITFLEELHKGQCEHHGCCKAHYGNRKEDNCFKIPEILEKGGREVLQKIHIDFCAVKGKENREDNCGDKTDSHPGNKAFSISEFPAQFQFVILYGFKDPKSCNNPIEKAVKNVGVKAKKG